MSKLKFKDIVKSQINIKSFDYLQELKLTHKIRHIKYSNWKMADYFSPSESNMSIEERKFIFKCRCEDLYLKTTKPWLYETEDIMCVCSQFEETPSHIIQCDLLLSKNDLLSYIPSYNDFFDGDLNEKMYAAKILKENIRIRQEIVNMNSS